MKSVTITCLLRDPEGNVIGNTDATGTTEDEGQTCVIGLGYLSQLATAQPGDVSLVVHQPATEYPEVDVVSVTPDIENNIQIVVLELPE